MTAIPYGAWPSPITAEFIISNVVSFAELGATDDALVWLEARPKEGGRMVLVRRADDLEVDLTPPPFNVRSRVHEYGGGAYALATDALATDALATDALATEVAYVVNFADQNIYRVAFDGSEPQAVTRGDATERFADLTWDGVGGRLLAVRERHVAQREPINDLVAIDPDSGTISVLHQGHDFYSNPRVAPDGTRLCFLVWDHPNMPWDGTQLVTAPLQRDGLGDATVIAGGVDQSIFQPEWITASRLVYVSDENGFWNLYSYDDSGIYCVLQDKAEYGAPQWSFGQRTYVPLDDRFVVCQRNDKGHTSLQVLDLDQGMISPLDDSFSSYASLHRTGDGIAFIGGRSNGLGAIVKMDLATKKFDTVKLQGQLNIDAAYFSPPSHIEFPTSGGATAYAYYYAPQNPSCAAAAGELPPLLVMSHGGPTGSASASLSLRVQYYTTRGWAVLDVNYGGSTGYGRAYRERLNGQWGRVDVDDCVAGVRHLGASGEIDLTRVAIRGGSAGGFTTLAALAFANTFKAGASHYGIGDLQALASDTHKFESRYIDRLVDPDQWSDRSPVNHIEDLNCPVIFFQGSEDKIVLPNQSEAMLTALRAKGLAVAYLLFEGEGHGFRQADNVKAAIEAEYLFFARVFGFEPAESLPEITIENPTWT